ncbi:hypothetical protein VULLAG_LOCUS18358 [Vulpes lagopus]
MVLGYLLSGGPQREGSWMLRPGLQSLACNAGTSNPAHSKVRRAFAGCLKGFAEPAFCSDQLILSDGTAREYFIMRKSLFWAGPQELQIQPSNSPDGDGPLAKSPTFYN